jgi:hypothetical protein
VSESKKVSSSTDPRKRVLLACLVAIGVVSSALALRDMARRDDAEVRGPKVLWRVFITINPGNSVFYWVFGRK